MAFAPRTVQNTFACVPHAGLLETGTDYGLAARLDHTRADEKVLSAKLGVAHALRVPFKVVGLNADLPIHLGIGGRDGP